jgi:haloacetate dehalogenase
MIRGMCEDYRAAATIDLEHDRASRSKGEKLSCPLLVLWGAKGAIGRWYDPLAIWRQYCTAEVSGGEVDSGHYLAEEAPAEVLAHFRSFFG